MQKDTQVISFFIALAKAHTILSNRFDIGLDGLSFNEFLILFYLEHADEKQMRRVDLARKIGLTPSGVTRLLLPMEKVHLVKSGTIETDARVRFVEATDAGREKYTEALERMQFLGEEVLPSTKSKELTPMIEFLIAMSGKALVV